MLPRLVPTLLACALATRAAAAERLIDLVQPAVGTARKDQTIGAANSGQTYPAVGVPFAMTHWTPETQATEDKCVSPYYHKDRALLGFRGTHWWSGSCTQDYGSVSVAVVPAGGDGALPLDHARERMAPHRYAIDVPAAGLRAEITGAARSGMMRFTFARAGEYDLVVGPRWKRDERKPDGRVAASAERREVTGTNPVRRLYAGKGQPAGFAGHFVAQVDAPFARVVMAPDAGPPAARVRLVVRAGQVVRVRVGTSFVSVDEARRNLAAEIPDWDFDALAARAGAAWEEALGRVRVDGGTADERAQFYTALYHALLMPRLFSDASGTYPSFAGGARVERAEGWQYYDDFSLWDTFRAVHPLLILIQPERAPSLVRSMLAKAEQGGWLPNFPGWNSYTSAMVGDHGAALIADAYVKGVRGFDAAAALAALRKNATASPDPAAYADGRGRRALGDYLRLGYIPLEQEVAEAFHKREQVSRTLEYAYDDFAVGALARALGRDDEAQAFFRRSRNYQNVIQPGGFARGRHADGRWAEPFDPAVAQSYITEGTPWQYTFFVPHDVQGLIARLGGRAAFVAKLDALFAAGQYWHGNEPSHHIAYLYDHAGAPWRTQEEVRRILAREYGLGPAGLRGNDDTGQMSAWYVLSAIGIYPVCPGSPHYEIGSPLFTEARVALPGGRTFTIRAPGASARNLYVQSATLDGRPYTRPWLAHEDVARGGTLVLHMGPAPSKRWGSAPADAPPSLSPAR